MQQQLHPIGAVAKLTGVPIKTIRYYADIGLLPPAATTDARYRLYGAAEIWRLELIRTLRNVGFSLEEIRSLLRGDVSIAQAIDVQLAAVSEQIAQLGRVQRVLERARMSAEHGDDSLRHLHELGTALNNSAAARRQLLLAKLRTTLPPDTPPTPLHEQFLERITHLLPETMTSEQTTIWAELVDLINDPAFITATQQQLAPFSQFTAPTDAEVRAGGAHMLALLQHALEAAAAGATADSPETQALVQAWLDAFAAMLQRPNTPEFAEWFAQRAPQFMPEEIYRFWELIGQLNGWGITPSYLPARRLLLAGIAWRVQKHVHA